MDSPDNSEVTRLIAEHAPGNGGFTTAIPGLRLFRQSAPIALEPCVQAPALAVIAQGAKELRLGTRSYRYDQGHFVVVSLDLPMGISVTKATWAVPYLGLRFDLDLTQLLSVAQELTPKPAGRYEALFLSRMGPDLLDPLLRLLRLLARPLDIPVMAPLLHREILYRLTQSEQGAHLRRLAVTNSEANRIERAVAWLKANAARPFSMKQLAEVANMSPSSLHHHFRAITASTPLMFQKHLRLHEARRLMLTRSLDVSVAASEVGYASPSQFSREYKRLFGNAPARDVRETYKTWNTKQ